MKCSDFQFSFSPIYKKFVRELRDEENKDPLVDTAYHYVKKVNNSRGPEQEKLSVMNYLNKLYTQFKNANNKMIDDGGFIEEVNAYSEETHSDLTDYEQNDPSHVGGANLNKSHTKHQKKGVSGAFHSVNSDFQHKYRQGDDLGRRQLQKRINELINSRYVPQVETVEKMQEKIQEINEIVRGRRSLSSVNGYFRDIVEGQVQGGGGHQDVPGRGRRDYHCGRGLGTVPD